MDGRELQGKGGKLCRINRGGGYYLAQKQSTEGQTFAKQQPIDSTDIIQLFSQNIMLILHHITVGSRCYMIIIVCFKGTYQNSQYIHICVCVLQFVKGVVTLCIMSVHNTSHGVY